MIAAQERFWSTTAVKPNQRFAFWHDAVSNAVLNVGVDTDARGEFDGWISARPRGQACFSLFAAAPHRILRTSQHLSRGLSESYLVSLQISGTARVEQRDRRFELQPSDIGIVDGELPFRVEFPDKVRRVVALLPRALVPMHQRDLATQLPKLASGHPLSILVRTSMMRLANADGAMSPAQAQVLLSNLCALLSVAGPETRHGLTPQALMAWISAHLAEQELSPAHAAAAFAVSIRTIHGAMAKAGTSFAAFLLQERLAACEEALRLFPKRAVSGIALDSGFNSAAHFHRTFKARFGMTPRDWQALKTSDNK